MRTMGDAGEFLKMTDVHMRLWGATAEVYREYRQRCTTVGESLHTELGLPPKTIVDLPPETKLPLGAEKLFAELEEWWKSQTR